MSFTDYIRGCLIGSESFTHAYDKIVDPIMPPYRFSNKMNVNNETQYRLGAVTCGIMTALNPHIAISALALVSGLEIITNWYVNRKFDQVLNQQDEPYRKMIADQMKSDYYEEKTAREEDAKNGVSFSIEDAFGRTSQEGTKPNLYIVSKNGNVTDVDFEKHARDKERKRRWGFSLKKLSPNDDKDIRSLDSKLTDNTDN